jgi:hypothetical protein
MARAVLDFNRQSPAHLLITRVVAAEPGIFFLMAVKAA